MIAALKNLFANVSGGQMRQSIAEEERRLAAAALLVHVATIDGEKSASENARVLALLQERFAISGDEARRLAEAADERDREAVDLYAFTSALKQKLDESGRLEIIDMMWDVAFADGVVHEFEENVIWRVAELLGVSARERIAARRRVARGHREQEA